MKTFWTESTVNRNADIDGVRPCDWLLTIQRHFEHQTGVKWSVCHQHGGYNIHPVDDGVTAWASAALAQRIIRTVRDTVSPFGYVSYLEVAEKTKIDLMVVMGVVKWMEKEGHAHRTVDRMGKGYAFKLVNE